VSRIIFDLYSKYFASEVLEGFGEFKIGGDGIPTERHTDELVLLCNEESMLQGLINRLIEIGRYYAVEINMKKLRSSKTYY
jgi:hypothetical protein